MAMSAFWHGFYSGYYTFFLPTAALTVAARELRRIVRPFFCKDEKTRRSTRPHPQPVLRHPLDSRHNGVCQLLWLYLLPAGP